MVTSLREKFWKLFGNNDINVQELMKHWDKLNLSWNSQDVLGCIIPNDPNHYALITARRMLLRPIEHWSTVHEEKKKAQKSQIFGSPPPPLTSSSLASSSASFAITSPKVNHRMSDLRQPTIQDVVSPKINFVGHVPKNENEEMALAHVLKILYVGSIKMVSSATVLEQYQTAVDIKEEQYQNGLICDFMSTSLTMIGKIDFATGVDGFRSQFSASPFSAPYSFM